MDKAFVPCQNKQFDRVFSIQTERIVNRDNTAKFKNMKLQIDRQKFGASLANCRVIVFGHLDSLITIGFGEHEVGRFNESGEPVNRNYGNAAAMEKSQTPFLIMSRSDFPTFPQFLLLGNKKL